MSELATAIMTNVPAIILLVLGYALVVVELYLPGFGIPGILGSIMLIAGVVIVSDTVTQAFILVSILLVLILLALFICMRSAARGRLAKSRLVLKEVATSAAQPAEKAPDYSEYLGREGEAVTVLRPAGMAEFDGVRLNVVTGGDYIASGQRVRVTEIRGNRIVVAPVRC